MRTSVPYTGLPSAPTPCASSSVPTLRGFVACSTTSGPYTAQSPAPALSSVIVPIYPYRGRGVHGPHAPEWSPGTSSESSLRVDTEQSTADDRLPAVALAAAADVHHDLLHRVRQLERFLVAHAQRHTPLVELQGDDVMGGFLVGADVLSAVDLVIVVLVVVLFAPLDHSRPLRLPSRPSPMIPLPPRWPCRCRAGCRGAAISIHWGYIGPRPRAGRGRGRAWPTSIGSGW